MMASIARSAKSLSIFGTFLPDFERSIALMSASIDRSVSPTTGVKDRRVISRALCPSKGT